VAMSLAGFLLSGHRLTLRRWRRAVGYKHAASKSGGRMRRCAPCVSGRAAARRAENTCHGQLRYVPRSAHHACARCRKRRTGRAPSPGQRAWW